ncbi:MAG: hypothetical protein JW751_14000 [Polyangiaceae bacterium]|nr:hypothetical protein [Polyangiaceae bacterium]
MSRYSIVTRTLRSLVLLVAVFVCCACGGSARLHITKNITTKLDATDNVYVTATGQTAKVARAARKLEGILAKRIVAQKVFREVSSSGDVVIACKVTHMEFGGEDTRELSLREKAQATVEVRITKPDGTLLGHITVTSAARRRNVEDEPAVRVLEQVADKVVEYLGEHVSRRAAATPKKKAAVEEPEEEEPEEGDAEGETGDDEEKEPEKDSDEKKANGDEED